MPTPSLHHRPLACAPALLLAIAALCMAPLAGAKEKTPPKHKTKTHKVVKSPQAMDSGSAESRHDRDRRSPQSETAGEPLRGRRPDHAAQESVIGR